MSSGSELLTQVFSQRPNIRSGGTDDADPKIGSLIVVRRQQRTRLGNRFELTNGDTNRQASDLFAAPGQLIKLAPGDLLG
jgi:hypothetical protein